LSNKEKSSTRLTTCPKTRQVKAMPVGQIKGKLMSYENQWEEYRKLSKQFLWAWIGYLPGMAVIGISISRFIETETPVIIIAVIWLCVCAVTAVRLGLWKCPKCGNRFALKGLYRNSATDKCLHCGLPKWAIE